MTRHILAPGRGADKRHHQSPDGENATGTFTSHAAGARIPVQANTFVPPHYPFQPLPTPLGPSPYRFDLGQLLHPEEVAKIASAGKMVFHSVGDTGDGRGRQMDFVAAMMTEDYNKSPDGEVPAFYYHLGDVVYFAGDIEKYGETFYETYANYPALIVSIPGNHDCQPDDPQDGPIDPTKKPLDGWVQNFMSPTPDKLGSLKTNSNRTQMDLPNVYWSFTTPLVTVIGLFSNVGETEAEIHQDQLDWFRGELQAADPDKALIVAIHHPPYSGDTEHSGSSEAEKILFQSFAATGIYPHLVLSGHVHNYQRFTVKQKTAGGNIDVVCIVAGNGGYTNLGKLHNLHGIPPEAPLSLNDTLTLEHYDQDNFGFMRFEVTKDIMIGTYFSAPYQVGSTPVTNAADKFIIDLRTRNISKS
jgi:hypothetical protein